MRGERLLQELLSNPSNPTIAESLVKALNAHLLTGQSLDSILKLNARKHERLPRTRILLQNRGALLLTIVSGIKEQYDLSLRQACHYLHDNYDDYTELHELDLLLSKKVTCPNSLYNSLVDIIYRAGV